MLAEEAAGETPLGLLEGEGWTLGVALGDRVIGVVLGGLLPPPKRLLMLLPRLSLRGLPAAAAALAASWSGATMSSGMGAGRPPPKSGTVSEMREEWMVMMESGSEKSWMSTVGGRWGRDGGGLEVVLEEDDVEVTCMTSGV